MSNYESHYTGVVIPLLRHKTAGKEERKEGRFKGTKEGKKEERNGQCVCV